MTLTTLDTRSLGVGKRSTRSIMLQVMLALIPGTLLYALLISSDIIINLVIASLSALVFEAVMLALRKRSVLITVSDGSIVLAAWLLVLCVPPALPAWQLVLGIFIMCSLGKHMFGGLGHNPFNPAMVAYAVLLVSFPSTMTHWSPANAASQSISVNQWDTVTGATPLDRIRNIKRAMHNDAQIIESVSEFAPTTPTRTAIEHTHVSEQSLSQIVLSSHWLWINTGWLLGGLFLLFRRIISWHIPVSIVATLTILYATIGAWSSAMVLPVFPAVFSGAVLLGAFFIATDPVSAATSNRGKLLYGIGIGVLCFVIREYSVYPEGFAFAVLLMNICVPLLDHIFTRT